MRVILAGEEQVGADAVWVLAWQQNSADSGMLEFIGNQAERRACRAGSSCGNPTAFRCAFKSGREHARRTATSSATTATVDYVPSTHGFLTPASVVHRHIIDGQLITENLYRYEPFKLFSADTEIKFTELPTCLPPSHPSKNEPHRLPARLRLRLPRPARRAFSHRACASAGAAVEIPDLAESDFEHLTLSGPAARDRAQPPPASPSP